MTNDYIVGALYPLNGGKGGIWSQPDGPFSPVYPQQEFGNTDYFSTLSFNERTGAYVNVCSHSSNYVEVIREYDYENGISVALICCALCNAVDRVIVPFEAAVTGSSNYSLADAILYP